MEEAKFTKGQTVGYLKNGQLMEIVSWKFDGKPGGPLYSCSDGGQHREWNLAPAEASQVADFKVKLEEAEKKHEEEQKKKAEKKVKIEKKAPLATTKEHAIQKWQIDAEMDLVQQASDFYLLNEAATDIPILGQFAERQAEGLADQFSRYLTMAIGGELRHTRTNIHNSSWISNNVIEILEELGKSGSWFHLSRNQVWYLWHDIFTKKSLKKQIALIKSSRRIFRRGRWSRSMGGNNWSKIALTLLNYLKGEYSATLFVDIVFGLYHNCNLVLDKVWQVADLKHTLDENFKHNMTDLYQTASPEARDVIALYKRFKGYYEQS